MRRLFLLVVLCATCSVAQVPAVQLPRAFEANRGQTDARVRFLSRGPGYVLFLTHTSAIFSLGGKDTPAETLEMRFLGVDPAAEPPVGSGSLEGQSNYYPQPDPGTWLTGIPNYSEVRYSALYHGIDVAFHWNQQQVEHDFIVHPGADPRAIRLRFVGARDARLDATGSLVVTAGTGKLAFHHPELYQERHGVRRAVRGSFVLGKDGHVGFRVGHYDHNRDLLIDPVLSYSTFFTGEVHAIAVDSSGSAYVTGRTDWPNFPTQAPAQPIFGGDDDAFVTKFSVAGNALIYSTYLGGANIDEGKAIAVDSAGNAYVTGQGSPGFPTTPGAFMTTCPDICNTPFVAKFLPDGSLGFSTFTGGSNATSTAIAVDSSGNSYITGTTASNDLPVVNPFQASFNGSVYAGTNAFVQKLNTTGTALLYSTYFGGSSDTYLRGDIVAAGIAVDTAGDIYIAGSASGAIPVKNPLQAGLAGSFRVANAFISKFTPDGSALVYSTYLGGSGNGPGGSGDQANAIAVDAAGNAYVTGSTVSADFPFSENAFQTTCFGLVSCQEFQVFALKLDSTGSQLLYSTLIGPGSGSAITVDASGNAYIAGGTGSTYFPSLSAIQSSVQRQQPYSSNAFVTELDRSGNLVMSSVLGGARTTASANGIALDPGGNIYIAGNTSGVLSDNDTADFPLLNPFQNTLSGSVAGFVAKISPSAGPALSVAPTTGPLLTLRNVSASTLAITSITPSGNLTMTSDCGSTLAAGASCHMVFQGPTSGSVTIASNAPESPQQFPVLAPYGGLKPYPVLLISNFRLTFGKQMVGTSSAPQIITLTNPASPPVSISAIDIIGDYTKVSNCPSSLSGGSSCQIAVSFAPKSLSSGTGRLSINLDSYDIYLAGIPQQDELSISTAAVNFGTQYVGSAPLPRIVTLTNIWQEPIFLASIAIQGDFAQRNNCPALLPAGASCRITVSFVPTMNSQSEGALTISHAGLGGPETVSLSGIGFILSDLSLSPLELTFSYTIPGTTSVSQPVTLTNSGSSSLTISSIATSQQFSQTDNCSATLGPGASCVVNVAFSPVAEGTFSGTLSVFHSGLGSPQIMSLTGIGQYALWLSATQLDFGAQPVNTSSTRPLSLANSSRTTTVAINSIAITGDFQVTQSYCGTSLAPQEGCSLSITFTPTTTGTRGGTVSVGASDAPLPHVAQLSGTGTQTASSAALRFIPVAPCRIADTRNASGPFGGPTISAQSSRSFVIPNSACNVPSTAAAYSLNVTAVPAANFLGYLTIWPTGGPPPLVSTLNAYDGRIKANAAIVPAGTGGAVSIYVTDPTDVVLDINGYFLPANDPAVPLAFFPLPPCRVADTRNTADPLGGPFLAAGQSRAFPVPSSSCNIPATALAYSLNFTVVPQGPLGYLTTWPTGMAQPLVSTLNASTGTYTANAAIVPAGVGGEISIYVTDATDLVIDINGYFAPSTSSTDLSLYTLPPCRVLDTRLTTGSFFGPIREDATASPCGIPLGAQGVVLNATVVPSQSLGFLTLWPDEETQPLVSTLNALDGLVTSNMAIVPTSSAVIDAYATGPTQLILDTCGYFASGTGP